MGALADNVVCGSGDPHHGHMNVLIHEFGHTTHDYAFSSSQKGYATQAYQNAKRYSLWTTNSYAMANEKEYMATAISVYMSVNKDDARNTGNMNVCSGHVCNSEAEARYHLYAVDKKLYNVLTPVLVSNRPADYTGLHCCN